MQFPPGDESLQLVAVGAAAEVTNPSKPLMEPIALCDSASMPWDALYWPTTIHRALFVHRVEGVAPGIYLLVRDPAKKQQLEEVIREEFVWQTPPGVPSGFRLYLLVETDCRRAARTLSRHQDIAADGFFSHPGATQASWGESEDTLPLCENLKANVSLSRDGLRRF